MVVEEKDNKSKEKTVATKEIKPTVSQVTVEKASDVILANLKTKRTNELFPNLDKMEVKNDEHVMCCHHNDLNRNPEIPCLEKTRVLLESEDNDSCDFIHANKVSFENIDRKYIISQIPMQENVENFWRMIFQNHSTTTVVLCSFGGKDSDVGGMFWPVKEGDYKNCGSMFINNKRTDQAEYGTVYTIEVLPEGCADAVVTKIHHLPGWEFDRKPKNIQQVLNLMQSINTETGPITVVSPYGIGRSCAFVLSEVIIAKLLKGCPAKLVVNAAELRRQRAFAFKEEVHYVSAALIVAEYIKEKFPKHAAAYNEFLRTVDD